MSGHKSSECSVISVEIDLFNIDTSDLDECQLRYNQSDADRGILFFLAHVIR